jgi:hypothetical protein
MHALTSAEINTLEILGNPECCEAVPRTHLEKLYRLDLIEPAAAGPALSRKGRDILVNLK